ncbi:acyl-CoA thioester hydrolase [Halogranum gelatinilyticum]|uniref:Acyl-CoA thioester hydrolase n=1 Tax=Halogranum gelatinilyticum TaxID=660521 RepID=A0A1G9WKE1_9EURY|nr:thioesterase family protein [Halogranum gelatinilyticum]SDM85004.1 acyl-CoA thioester hydrolase [Halogranum gelatinilyticum]
MSEFNHEVDITVRYRDLDPWGHVNNAVYVTYLEHARVDYLDAVLDVELEDIDVVVANLEIDYEQSITIDDDVTVAMGVSNLGTSSYTMTYEVRVGDDVAATAETTQVVMDRETGRPTPMDDAHRETLAAFEGLD